MPTTPPLHMLSMTYARRSPRFWRKATRATERTDPSRPNPEIRPEKPTNLRWLWGKDLMFRPGETFHS